MKPDFMWQDCFMGMVVMIALAALLLVAIAWAIVLPIVGAAYFMGWL